MPSDTVCMWPSAFATASTPPSEKIPLATLHERIRDGYWAAQVAHVRKVLKSAGEDAYREAKTKLAAFAIAGDFTGRSNNSISAHYGRIVQDFDHITDPIALRERAVSDPHVLLAFISPSGDGVKVVFRTRPCESLEDHRHAWAVCAAYAQQYWGAVAASDPANKDTARLCFVSHDPDAHLNEAAEPLFVPPFNPAPAVAPKPVNSDLQSAIDKYNLDHARDWGVGGKEECPVCKKGGRFGNAGGKLAGLGQWVCFGQTHFGTGVGLCAGAFHHGDALDIDAYLAGRERIEHLRAEGYLTSAPPTTRAASEDNGSRMEIRVRDDDLGLLLDEAWASFDKYNADSPRLFRFAGRVTDLYPDASGKPGARVIGPPVLREHMARAARYFKVIKKKDDDGFKEKPSKAPADLAVIMHANPSPRLPELERVARCPMFSPSGRIVFSDGYDKELRCFLHVGAGGVPAVPDKPTSTDMRNALEFMMIEVLGDYPFVSDSDKANALAMYLLPFVRPLITGATPLHLIEKPSPSSGGTFMAKGVGMLACMSDPTIITEGDNDEEWRKRITSTLLGTPEIIVIDNTKRRLDSPSLASALTADVWVDRKLGSSENVTVPVKCVWIATGNNPLVSSEIARRCVSIRVDPKTDKPHERSGWRHPDLLGWIASNRSKLMWACMTIVQNWFVSGRPQGDVAMGSYESYSKTMGGILLAAKVDGFLGNRARFHDRADQESVAWRDFLELWHSNKGFARVTANDLLEYARETEPCYLGEGKDANQCKKLGNALGRILDRVYHVHNLRLCVKTPKEKLGGKRVYYLTNPDEDLDEAWLSDQADKNV